MVDIIKAAILGVVEGITEFLPISSTGHLIIVNKFIDFQGDFAKTFDVVIQLGAILAVVIFFWSRIWPFGHSKSSEDKREIWSIWLKTLVAVLPALAIGVVLGKKIHAVLFNPLVVAVALFIGGIALIIIENRKNKGKEESLKDLSLLTAFWIGLIQCLAMVPGTSRSAATIIGAMLLGLSRTAAAEFSFFLAIPTLAAASGYELMKAGFQFSSEQWVLLGVGFTVSFLVAWAVIALFMNYIRKHDFKPFGIYRIILGIAVIAYFALNGGLFSL